jgi:addiction module RelB/DinJ family antitoxin
MNSVVITSPAKATIQTDLAKKADVVFKRLGLSREQAIDLFFEACVLQQNLPFSFNQPNDETLQAFKDSEQGIDLVECKDADDFFSKLGI